MPRDPSFISMRAIVTLPCLVPFAFRVARRRPRGNTPLFLTTGDLTHRPYGQASTQTFNGSLSIAVNRPSMRRRAKPHQQRKWS
jgi:hypothetical protein